MQILTILTHLQRENSEKLGFPTTVTIFTSYLQLYMWFYKCITVNILAITQKFVVALFYKINPVQITTIIAENTENSLNSVPHTIDSSIQICERFSPIVKLKFGIFLKCHGYCYTIIANCSHTNCQRQH